MAVDLTLKSNAITNREATPSVANDPGTGGASKLKVVNGFLASIPSAVSATSIIRMVEVPSNAVIHRIILQSDDLGSTGNVHIGVYRTNRDGGALVNTSFFATAVSLSAVVVRTDVTNESGTNTIAKQNQPLWQALGMTADPKSALDIALTVSTDATAASGAIGLLAEYSD